MIVSKRSWHYAHPTAESLAGGNGQKGVKK
jgi:hypothetical protein